MVGLAESVWTGQVEEVWNWKQHQHLPEVSDHRSITDCHKWLPEVRADRPFGTGVWLRMVGELVA